MEHNSNNHIRALRATEFCSMLPDVQFSASGKTLVTVSIDGDEVYREWLWPDNDGHILLEHLTELVEPFAYEKQTVTVAITAADTERTTVFSAESTVVYCMADFGDETAASYLENHFLSILQGPKLTAHGRLEILPVQGTGLTATCTASYSDGTTASFAVEPYLELSSFTELDASPDNFTAEGKTLIGYEITVGSRTQAYEIDFNASDCSPILIFENSFGVEEVIYCTGRHSVEPSYKRSMAYVGRHQRNYRIDETRSFKADTGPLTFSMANWLDDLFRSKFVRVANLYDGTVTPGKEVVITESKSAYGNGDDELPRFTFTYQYAQRNHNVVQLLRTGRIFDNTFDNTFN